MNEFKQPVITKAVSAQAHGSGEATRAGRASKEPQSQQAEQRFLRTAVKTLEHTQPIKSQKLHFHIETSLYLCLKRRQRGCR